MEALIAKTNDGILHAFSSEATTVPMCGKEQLEIVEAGGDDDEMCVRCLPEMAAAIGLKPAEVADFMSMLEKNSEK